MSKLFGFPQMNASRMRSMIRGLGRALLVSLLVGNQNAAAEGLLTFSPPAQIIEVGSSTVIAFQSGPEGYGFIHLSSSLPAECPNVYLHIFTRACVTDSTLFWVVCPGLLRRITPDYCLF